MKNPWSKTHSLFRGRESCLSAGRVRLLPSDPRESSKVGPDPAVPTCAAALRGKSPTEQGLQGQTSFYKNPTAQKLRSRKKALPAQTPGISFLPTPHALGTPQALGAPHYHPPLPAGGKGTFACKWGWFPTRKHTLFPNSYVKPCHSKLWMQKRMNDLKATELSI